LVDPQFDVFRPAFAERSKRQARIMRAARDSLEKQVGD
jgi:hypothetical protein